MQAIDAQIVQAKAYGTGNADYLAATALLSDLQSQKAKMVTSGAATFGKVGKDAQFVAWATGKPVDDASRILWMVIVGVLDVASTLAHLYAALSRPREDYIIGQCVNQVSVLLRNGFTQDEVFTMLGNRGTVQQLENQEGRDFEKKQLPQGVSDETQAAHDLPHVKVGKPDDLPHVKVGKPDDLPHVKVGNAVCEDCAASFTSRVAWQVRCPDCQAKKRALNATGRRKGAIA